MTAGLRGRHRREAASRALLLALALSVFLLPLVWTALASFGLQPNNNTKPPSWVGSPTLEHVLEVGVAEPAFWQELSASTTSAGIAAALTVFVSFLAAYGLARSRFRGDRLFTQGFLVLASLPAMAYVIPLADLMRRVHLADTFVGLILAEAAVTAPLAVYVLHGAIGHSSADQEEAAMLDGADLMHVLLRVVLPLAAPSIAATAIILFVLDWNLLLVPLALASDTVRTLPVAMVDFFTFERELEWPTAAAALMISLIPVVILVAIFHRVLDRFSLDAERTS